VIDESILTFVEAEFKRRDRGRTEVEDAFRLASFGQGAYVISDGCLTYTAEVLDYQRAYEIANERLRQWAEIDRRQRYFDKPRTERLV
jgi:hypothetical protein